MNIRQDYSYLFTSINNSKNNNSIYGINLTEYASIKNGSYGKLLKSYYKELNAQPSASDKNTTDKYGTVNKTEAPVNSAVRQEVTDLQKSVDKLQDSASRLLQKGSSSLFKSEYSEKDKEALYKAVSQFATDYNSMIDKGGNSSFSSISGMAHRMENTAGDYREELSSLGISLDNSGKISVNKDAFMNADMDQVKKIFNKDDSFAYFVSKRANNIEDAISNVARRNNIDIAAIKKENQSAGKNSVNNDSNVDDKTRKEEMVNMQKMADELHKSADKLLQQGSASLFKDQYNEKDKEALYTAVSGFVSNYNTVLEKGTASSVKSIANMAGRMKSTADDYQTALEAIGISVGEKKLTIDKDSFMSADMELVKNLFNKNNSFGYFVSERAETINLTAQNEANMNNLYTSNATYNNISSGTLYTGIV